MLIRAVQGHSNETVVDPGLTLLTADNVLPANCVHGTYWNVLDGILSQGLHVTGRTTLRVGLAGGRVTISGTVVKSENGLKQTLESVSWELGVELHSISKMLCPGTTILMPVSEHFMISRPTPKS
jgi:hypothetical protein